MTRAICAAVFLGIAVPGVLAGCGPKREMQSASSVVQQSSRAQAQPAGQSYQAPPPQVQPQPQADATVYITRTGSKFHRAGCRSLSRSSSPISRPRAVQQGYQPCSVCNP